MVKKSDNDETTLSLREKVSAQDTKLDSIAGDVKSIVVALKGDDFGNEGIVMKIRNSEANIGSAHKKIDDHITDVNKKEAVKKGQIWLLGFLGGIMGAIGTVLVKFLPIFK